MKKLINSMLGKYVVNVLMIVILAMLLISTYLGGEGEKQGGNKSRHHEVLRNPENATFNKTNNAAIFNLPGDFEKGHVRDEDGNHKLLGSIWLILMFFHTVQHWNWYKKMFSQKLILNNKLLFATVLVFSLFSVSCLVLLMDVPVVSGEIKEVHEFLGPLTIGLVLIHVLQRINWYIKTTKAIKFHIFS